MKKVLLIIGFLLICAVMVLIAGMILTLITVHV
jgi:hypothetical protein